jgi:hypothetical protein
MGALSVAQLARVIVRTIQQDLIEKSLIRSVAERFI